MTNTTLAGTKPHIPYGCQIVRDSPESERGARSLDYLLAHPSLIQEDWDGREFPDTIYRDLDGGPKDLIRCLVRLGPDKWSSKLKVFEL